MYVPIRVTLLIYPPANLCNVKDGYIRVLHLLRPLGISCGYSCQATPVQSRYPHDYLLLGRCLPGHRVR